MDLFTWYVIRASGLVAWALVCASVTWGLLLTTRVLGGNPRPPWLLDLHRFLGGLSVLFVGVHVGGLLLDRYVPFGPTDVLVPLASHWHPVWVAFGVVAMYLLVAIEGTSLLMRRLPKRLWKQVHLSSFVLFGCAAAHGFLAGTDRASTLLQIGLLVVITLFVFLVTYRQVNPRRLKVGAARAAARAAQQGAPLRVATAHRSGAPARRRAPAPPLAPLQPTADPVGTGWNTAPADGPPAWNAAAAVPPPTAPPPTAPTAWNAAAAVPPAAAPPAATPPAAAAAWGVVQPEAAPPVWEPLRPDDPLLAPAEAIGTGWYDPTATAPHGLPPVPPPPPAYPPPPPPVPPPSEPHWR